MNGFVFITALGLCQFKTIEKAAHYGQVQYKGKIKYPSGVFTGNWKRWADLDYWFDENQIFESAEKAIEFITKQHRNGTETN